MYVNGLAYVKAKSGESEFCKNDNRVREGCVVYPWLLNVYMDGVMKEAKMGIKRMGVIFFRWGPAGTCFNA